CGCCGYCNSGGQYDPSTDSWTATSTSDAPDGRANHTAVWTGNQMVVWGGGADNWLNTGGRYNPSTDNWTATSTTNAPTARGGLQPRLGDPLHRRASHHRRHLQDRHGQLRRLDRKPRLPK